MLKVELSVRRHGLEPGNFPPITPFPTVPPKREKKKKKGTSFEI